jgi:hypothetical protein
MVFRNGAETMNGWVQPLSSAFGAGWFLAATGMVEAKAWLTGTGELAPATRGLQGIPRRILVPEEGLDIRHPGLAEAINDEYKAGSSCSPGRASPCTGNSRWVERYCRRGA